MIHISELADIAVAEPLKTVQIGDNVYVKVLRVDSNRQRIGLSLRQAVGTQPVDADDDEDEDVDEPVAGDEQELDASDADNSDVDAAGGDSQDDDEESEDNA